MRQPPNLLRTLKLALKQLEAASPQAQSDADFEDARPGLRQWIEHVEGNEEVDPGDFILNLQDLCLNRKGILVAASLSAANVRSILRNKEFENLAEEESNESIVGRMIDIHAYYEHGNLRKIEERLELLTARDMVEDAGLVWLEDKET